MIGDNGAGKSTFARAVALTLAGPQEAGALALKLDWNDWIRKGFEDGSIRLDLSYDQTLDRLTGRGPPIKNDFVSVGVQIKRGGQHHEREGARVNQMRIAGASADRHLWGGGKGWFCASYGPFRRFSGGDQQYDRLFHSNPRLAPHLSVFGEDVALSKSLEWLKELHIERLESPRVDNSLDDLSRFINESDLLPHGTRLTGVSSKAITFTDGNGCNLVVDDLSDGYRSVLSMVFELVRQMVRAYDREPVFRRIRDGEMIIDLPGVVIIDEIDTHLHPSWQRRIGDWFTKLFPKLQFIVTTHSPLICHPAEKGSIWKLPAPGQKDAGGRITGRQYDRLVYGTVLDALGTDLFGEAVTRSKSARERLDRLATLNVKSRRTQLTEAETQEHQDLLKQFAAVLAGEEPRT